MKCLEYDSNLIIIMHKVPFFLTFFVQIKECVSRERIPGIGDSSVPHSIRLDFRRRFIVDIV